MSGLVPPMLHQHELAPLLHDHGLAHLAQDHLVPGREHLSAVSYHLTHHCCIDVRCGTEAQISYIIVQPFDMGVMLVVD